MESYDVAVIGGGPAGLAGALWLARYRLSTCLFDDENPRNATTWAIHGYLGLPDPPPSELRRIGREQATAAGARLESRAVTSVTGEIERFRVETSDGHAVSARRILFATGLRDIIPEITGLMDHYGRGIWHCPDCDGPTVAGLRVGVLGWGRSIAAFCMEMLTWTTELVVFTHGHDPDLPGRSRQALDRHGIEVVTEPIERVIGSSSLSGVVLRSGRTEPLGAMFFHIAYGPGCSIPADLKCDADEDGTLIVDADFQTSVPGVYAAGDITHGSKLAIRAAGDGTRAAIGIYRSLMPEDRRV